MAIGMIAGIVVGILAQNTPIVTDITKFLGDIFIRLIRMVVVPLVFATLVAGAAGISDTAKLGRVAVKTMLYYLLTPWRPWPSVFCLPTSCTPARV